jgi:hypothetical protein
MSRVTSVVLMALAIILVPAAAADAGIRLPWRSKAKAQVSKPAKVQTKEMARVNRDVLRLETLLAEVKTSAKLSEKSWKSVANEADMLAARIHANMKSATSEKNALRDAEQLRTHVQRLRTEAYKGDYKSTRRHAARALSVATRLDEWAG